MRRYSNSAEAGPNEAWEAFGKCADIVRAKDQR